MIHPGVLKAVIKAPTPETKLKFILKIPLCFRIFRHGGLTFVFAIFHHAGRVSD